MAGNPFAGGPEPIKYTPKVYVDPVTKTVYRLMPGGLGWEVVGQEIPSGHEPPVFTPIPQSVIDYVRAAPPPDTIAVAYASAISLAHSNAAYNDTLYSRWVDAVNAHNTTGQGHEPIFPDAYYRPSDFAFLLFHTRNGIPVPMPPEIDFHN